MPCRYRPRARVPTENRAPREIRSSTADRRSAEPATRRALAARAPRGARYPEASATKRGRWRELAAAHRIRLRPSDSMDRRNAAPSARRESPGPARPRNGDSLCSRREFAERKDRFQVGRPHCLPSSGLPTRKAGILGSRRARSGSGATAAAERFAARHFPLAMAKDACLCWPPCRPGGRPSPARPRSWPQSSSPLPHARRDCVRRNCTRPRWLGHPRGGTERRHAACRPRSRSPRDRFAEHARRTLRRGRSIAVPRRTAGRRRSFAVGRAKRRRHHVMHQSLLAFENSILLATRCRANTAMPRQS